LPLCVTARQSASFRNSPHFPYDLSWNRPGSSPPPSRLREALASENVLSFLPPPTVHPASPRRTSHPFILCFIGKVRRGCAMASRSSRDCPVFLFSASTRFSQRCGHLIRWPKNDVFWLTRAQFLGRSSFFMECRPGLPPLDSRTASFTGGSVTR